MRATVADVTKPLAAVADMVDAGQVVVFSKHGSFAVNELTGEKLAFTRRTKVYEFEMAVEPFTEGGGTAAAVGTRR